MFLSSSLIFIYLICLASFLFLEKRIAFVLSTLKPILLSRPYCMAFNLAVSSILVIFYTELPTIIIPILSAKDKVLIKYLSSI